MTPPGIVTSAMHSDSYQLVWPAPRVVVVLVSVRLSGTPPWKQLQHQHQQQHLGAHKTSSSHEEGAGHLQLQLANNPSEAVQVSPTNASEIVATVDQTLESLEESNSGSCGDWTLQDDHNNTRRKYARRSLRGAGGGTLVGQQAGNGYCNGKTLVVSHAAKVLQRRCNPSRGERRCPSDKSGHPSQQPEGSLLHCLYLQLLAAGSEGMNLKEIFASFASQTRFSRLGSNWRDQVKSYLKSSAYFKGVKARYFLCEQPQSAPKASKADGNAHLVDSLATTVEPKVSPGLNSPDAKSTQVDGDTPQSSPDPSVVNNEREGVQTRRKTYERTIEAVLNESAVEFQKTQKLDEIGDDRSTDEFSTASRRSDLYMATATVTTQPETATIRGSKKRKSLVHGGDDHEPSNSRHTGAVPGSLKAMQARIVAETGIQNGARCSRKDGSNNHSKWQCPMMAMEGRSLCQHHNFLSERKKARYKKAKRQASGKQPPLQHREIEQERSARKNYNPVHELQDLNKPPVDSMENAEHSPEFDAVATPAPVNKSNVSSSDRIVRSRSDAHTNGSQAESNNGQTSEDIHSETESGQPLSKSRSLNPAIEPGRHSFRSTRKPRMYLAAKKTAEKTPVVAPAPGKSVKKQSVPLIRPPSIPPLPMLYGVRRKSMKSKSQLTL